MAGVGGLCREMRGGIITPDQESATTRVGAAQGHSQQQQLHSREGEGIVWGGGASAQHHLDSSSSTRTIGMVGFGKTTQYCCMGRDNCREVYNTTLANLLLHCIAQHH